MKDPRKNMNVLIVLSKTPERIALIASSEIVAAGYGTFQLLSPQQCRIRHLKESRIDNLNRIIFSILVKNIGPELRELI